MISAALMTAGWITIAFSSSATFLLLGRFVQGYSMGFLAILGSVLIGEYCSPNQRGALLATITLFVIIGISVVHFLGTCLSWPVVAAVFSGIALLDFLIILFSPESPTFLAAQGRYDECRRAFHWLRGHGEDEELEKLIKTSMARKDNSIVKGSILNQISDTIKGLKAAFLKKEVYKPIIISMHLYAMNQWAGGIIFDVYTKDIIDITVGKDVSYGLVVVSIDIQRLISCLIGIITIKKMRRRFTLATTMSINIMSHICLASYVYMKTNDMLKFDHPVIGILLLHVYTFSQCAGAMTLANILPGEIFPGEHRGLCGMFGILFFSINETINIKSVAYLFSTIGFHGALMIYGTIVTYSVAVALYMLPETKDRTLLDIEEEFRGEPLITEANLVEKHAECEKVKIVKKIQHIP